MRHFHSKKMLRIMLNIAVCVMALMTPSSLGAQKSRPIPSPPAETSPDRTYSSPNLRTPDQAQIEMSLLMSRRTLIGELERERRRLAAQLAQDLQKLDLLNVRKIVPLSAAAQPDYKNLAQAAADIKARAMRIKYFSPFGLVDKTGEKIRYEADPGQLTAMLPELSRVISQFVGSPVFRISAPNDAELRSQAGHDLESIIKLSDAINKIAKRLSKPLIASR